MGEMVEVVGHHMVVHKEVEVHRTAMGREVEVHRTAMGREVEVHRTAMGREVEVHRTAMGREVVEVGLAFDNIVVDNIETAERMVVNIGAGNIVIGNTGDIEADIHSPSSGILLDIHSRSLKDSHHILVDCNYIDKSGYFAPPY
jgi:hypothetical protein